VNENWWLLQDNPEIKVDVYNGKKHVKDWISKNNPGIAVVFRNVKEHVKNTGALCDSLFILKKWSEVREEYEKSNLELKKLTDANQIKQKTLYLDKLKKNEGECKAVLRDLAGKLKNGGSFRVHVDKENLELLQKLIAEEIYEERQTIYEHGNIPLKITLEKLAY
jgi:hypothetical protein